MSADNGIFIYDHPKGYGVVHHTLTRMPHDISEINHAEETCYGDKLKIFMGENAYNKAIAHAYAMQRQMINAGEILEYGICDFTNSIRDYKYYLHS